ncbi:MAG TPA: TetR/AcrR family transcriptional regulator [Polyangiaceae bacterium]|nr:TetR/AcrR family transcriptional regulator [Polyangiaceae bacterium]
MLRHHPGAPSGPTGVPRAGAPGALEGVGVGAESSSPPPVLAASGDESARRRQLLDAALGVFLKFGFRKTSMDEVARAANVSRQGLYLHFAKKEALFRAVVQHALEGAFRAAEERLADDALPIRERLVGAFDEWVGRHVGMLGAGVSDLGEATHALVGPLMRQYGERFVELLAKFMRSSGLLAAYKPAGLTARQLAETLYATARGFKSDSATRADFGDSIGKAVRAFCLPLGGRG